MILCTVHRAWDCGCCRCRFVVSAGGFYVRVPERDCPVHDR